MLVVSVLVVSASMPAVYHLRGYRCGTDIVASLLALYFVARWSALGQALVVRVLVLASWADSRLQAPEASLNWEIASACRWPRRREDAHQPCDGEVEPCPVAHRLSPSPTTTDSSNPATRPPERRPPAGTLFGRIVW
ncbi:hypothetical protein [Microbispora sp. NPDC046933]|uniref:hypothetical protein n=1 Tax=Microbispora sp. NPDC046933 TaxID=3155618 RepID=UPI0033F2463D